mgnify:CR=1 FL=1
MVEIGDKIRIISDNPYYTEYIAKTWKVKRIFSNQNEYPLYDMSVHPEKLVECEGLSFLLYEYEFEVV